MTKYERFSALAGAIALLALAACSNAGSTSTGSPSGGPPDGGVGSGPQPIAAISADGPAARGAAGPTADVAGVCLSADEAELGRLINEYRASKGLPPAVISKSLTLVAQQHVWDSINNWKVNWPPAPPGKECNLHSWSNTVNPALREGTWTGVCYTSDHANAQGQWIKPAEIAGFPGEAGENSFWTSNQKSPGDALEAWKNSPGHNNSIIEQGGWGRVASIGIGMGEGWAHLWLSGTEDPQGAAPVCANSAPQPTAAQPTAEQPAPALPTTEPATLPAATAEAPTAEFVASPVPPAPPGPTGPILDATGAVDAATRGSHTFAITQRQLYTIVITPSAELDIDPEITCTVLIEGSFDGFQSFGVNFHDAGLGGAETFTFEAPGTGDCTLTVGGRDGTAGSYTLAVSAQ
jgi:uncharacterized protein YkwD